MALLASERAAAKAGGAPTWMVAVVFFGAVLVGMGVTVLIGKLAG